MPYIKPIRAIILASSLLLLNACVPNKAPIGQGGYYYSGIYFGKFFPKNYKKGIDEQYGARPLKREIEKIVSTPLAQKLLSEDVDKDSVVNITESKGKAIFKIEKKVNDEAFYMSDEYKERAVGG